LDIKTDQRARRKKKTTKESNAGKMKVSIEASRTRSEFSNCKVED